MSTSTVARQPARWVWAIVIAQVALLLGWAGYHEVIRMTAPTVLLKTLPVDPRDVLRGDYMILSYELSRAEESVKRPATLEGPVFVLLKPSGRHYVISEIRNAEPEPDEKLFWVHANAWDSSGQLRLDYGIEEFFVPEGRGTPRFDTLEVEASISGDHRFYIRQVWLDGKRFP